MVQAHIGDTLVGTEVQPHRNSFTWLNPNGLDSNRSAAFYRRLWFWFCKMDGSTA